MDVCVCVCTWLFTQGPLENAARVSEACRPADEVKGFRVPHNSPLSICPQGEWTLRNDTVAALVQGEGLQHQQEVVLSSQCGQQ